MPQPNRRQFLTAAAGLAGSLAVGRQARAAARPNLLLLHCDQLSAWAVSCYAPELTSVPNYGATIVPTPHLDRLAAEGARLTRFFTNSAVCTPSRGCLFTGRYPHAHGAYQNDIPLNRDEVTLGEQLRRHGYATGYAGKWHLDGEPKPGFMTPDRSMGFSDCRYMFNRGHWKQIFEDEQGNPSVKTYREMGDEQSYPTDYLATKTIEFAASHRDDPWAYCVSLPDPHTPFTVRPPYDTRFKPEDMPVPHTFSPHQDGPNKKLIDEAELRRRKAAYCGLVQCIDDNVGRILTALEQSGQLDQTLLVFTTDHGEYLGEHNRWGKNQWYRTAYQLPFLVRWPGHVPAGRTIDHFLTNVDVMPTLLSLLGQPHSGREQGRDAAGLLRGESVPWVEEAQIHHSSLRSAAVFTPRHELVLQQNGQLLLFDRQADPEQTNNLAGDPAHRAAMEELAEKLIAHHREVESPAAKWLSLDLLNDGLVARADDGTIYRQAKLEADTRQTPQATFTRLITTPAGLLKPHRTYEITFDYCSGGLGTEDSAFYTTLRPGNDRTQQLGPTKWRAGDGEEGQRKLSLQTGEHADFTLLIGIYKQGALTVENLVIREIR